MYLSAAEVVKMAARRNRSDQRGLHVNGFDDIPRPFLIGVSGGTASGKSTVCAKIMDRLGQNEVDSQQKQVNIIAMESFYKQLNEKEREDAVKGQYNFDHPDALDEAFMFRTLKEIKDGRTVKLPMYDYKTQSSRKDEYHYVYPADVILFEGILVFYFKEVRDLFNMKLFVDTDADTRLSRRVIRDVQERGRDLEQVLYQYTTFVKPAFEEFCLPTKKHADVIIPRGADNTVAIDLIVQHIQEFLRPSKSGIAPRPRHHSDSYVGRPH